MNRTIQADPSSSYYVYFERTGQQSDNREQLDITRQIASASNQKADTNEIKNAYETYILKRLISKIMSVSNKYDDAFDAIYFADLSMDSFCDDDIDVLDSFSNIVDLSDTISFDDDWDD
ncbi:hypothetical protein KKI24_28630 [bacterium]|nr:hypothetical protein [bacterium]